MKKLILVFENTSVVPAVVHSFVSNYCHYHFFSFVNLRIYEFELGQGALLFIRDKWVSNKREQSDWSRKKNPKLLFIVGWNETISWRIRNLIMYSDTFFLRK